MSQATSALPAAWRVEIFRAPHRPDPEGEHATEAARELGIEGLERLRLGRGYLLPPHLDQAAARRICAELLADPVVDVARITAPEAEPERPAGVRRILVAPQP
ncbi:MAG: phosphoribosylformylglycinamidine synthase subunit PurS, partial [Planctomycetota bacterium]